MVRQNHQVTCVCILWLLQHRCDVLHACRISAISGACGKYGTGYLAILIGALFTMVIQSSSIFTSALTPLCGIGVVSIERLYPFTLGANIGTTFTAIMAALAQDGNNLQNSLRVSMCHLFFNISGIILWYPLPFMRKVPIILAKKLGNTTAKYRWFAIFYLIISFFILPAIVFGLSLAGWEYLLAFGASVVLLFIIIVIINILQSKKPQWLPAKLRTWFFLPLCCHSLKPVDKVMSKMIISCRCCTQLDSKQDSNNNNDSSAEEGRSGSTSKF